MPHSLEFSVHSLFCVNVYIAKMNMKITCNLSFDRYSVSLQVILSFLKFPYLFLLIKYI